jgi:hypothetical protein
LGIALVAAGLGYVLISGEYPWDREQASASDESLPTPRSITRGGVTYKVGPTSPAGATLDPSDPRVLTLYAMDVEAPHQPECSWLDPQARIVEESSDVVRIATFHYSLPIDDGEETICSFTISGADAASQYDAMTLRLRDALGERRLIDERSGEDIGLLDPKYTPTPTYLPAGYQRSMVSHFTPQDSFVALGQYSHRPKASTLEIQVRSTTAWAQLGTVVARDRVADSDAVVTEEDYQRCVSWSPRAGLVAEVCSLGTFLAPSELLRIAESMPDVP